MGRKTVQYNIIHIFFREENGWKQLVIVIQDKFINCTSVLAADASIRVETRGSYFQKLKMYCY